MSMFNNLFSCYALPLAVGDERIERFLQAFEAASQEKLDHYVPRIIKPRKFKTSRIEHVSRWLPFFESDYGPDSITNGKVFDHVLLVNMWNDNGMLVDPTNACAKITVQCEEASVFYELVAPHFVAISMAAGAFNAVLSSPKSANQLSSTKKDYEFMMKLADADHDPSGQLKRIWESRKEEYRYDLTAVDIFGLTPDNRRYQLRLDWMNYWDDATAESLKFPDPVRDKPLEGLYERIGNKGFFFKITSDPLDLDIPVHLARMQWAYDRFGLGE